MFEERIVEAFKNTELTLEQMATEFSVSYKVVWNTVAKNFSLEERQERKRKNYRTSKLGNKNPMKGKCLQDHHNWRGGEVEDGKGYIMVNKPDWFTARKGSKYVFKHTLVFCEALGLTHLPKGFAVHHIDRDTKNNSIDNLALVTIVGHSKIHSSNRKARKCNDHPVRE